MTDFNLDAPAHFITITWNDDDEQWTLDIGGVPHFEAKAVLEACVTELDCRNPEIKVRSFGAELVDDEPEE